MYPSISAPHQSISPRSLSTFCTSPHCRASIFPSRPPQPRPGPCVGVPFPDTRWRHHRQADRCGGAANRKTERAISEQDAEGQGRQRHLWPTTITWHVSIPAKHHIPVLIGPALLCDADQTAQGVNYSPVQAEGIGSCCLLVIIRNVAMNISAPLPSVKALHWTPL